MKVNLSTVHLTSIDYINTIGYTCIAPYVLGSVS